MLGFVIGCMVGGTVGVLTACCCAAAGSADRRIETPDQKRHVR